MRPRLRALITAGGTAEPIDDVRVVANHSTGRLGAALARALAWRGVDVTVIGSARMLAHEDWLPPTVRRISYRSFADFSDALDAELAHPPDLLMMAAAVSDYSPVPHDGKLRSDQDELVVRMRRNPKLLDTLRERCPKATLIGFKLLSGASSEELLRVASEQRTAHGLDLTIANDMAELSHTRHPVWIVGMGQPIREEGTREDVADAVVAAAVRRASPGAPAALRWTPMEGPVTGRARCWWLVPGGWADGDRSDLRDPTDAVRVWLARRRTMPWRPVSLPLARGAVAVGLGEVDQQRTAEAWAHVMARAHELVPRSQLTPIWYQGVLAGAAATDSDGVRTLVSTELADDELWPQAVLPDHDSDSAPWAVPTHTLDAWRDRGFAPREAHGAVQLVTPPWQREDVKAAASAALVHLPTRTVLAGRRLRGPAEGGLAFPGGSRLLGESDQGCARRELFEEVGISAPHESPWFTRRIWRGRDPVWSLAAHVWRLPTQLTPHPSNEMNATWMPMAELLRDRDTLPGARLVLEDLRERVEAL